MLIVRPLDRGVGSNEMQRVEQSLYNSGTNGRSRELAGKKRQRVYQFVYNYYQFVYNYLDRDTFK